MADFKIKVVDSRRRIRPKPKTVITVVLVIALCVVLWSQRDLLAQIVDAMGQGALMPLILACVLEGARITGHALAYTRSFAIIHARVPLSDTIPAWYKAIFMNTVLPSGGATGLASVIDTARKRGCAVGSATSATIFTQTCFYAAMLLVIIMGYTVMFRAGSLKAQNILVGSIMGVATLVFVGLLAMGHLKPSLLQRFLRWVEALVVRVLRKLRVKKVPAPWADGIVRSFSSAATEITRNPLEAARVFGCMVFAMGMDAACFVACGHAFGITELDALLAGYTTAIVFNSFTVTPGGVGVVEGLSAAVLMGYGFPSTLCISCVLVYRAFSYWIPFAIGGVLMRVTKAFDMGRTPAEQTRADEAAARQNEAVYVRRARSNVPLRQRLGDLLTDEIELRTILACICVAACGLTGMFAAGAAPDPMVVEVVTSYALPDGPIAPYPMLICAFLLVMCVPGLLIHDQGIWLLTVVVLMGLAGSSTLAAHGMTTVALAFITLVVLVVWQRCFMGHDFLRSKRRLGGFAAYAVVVALLYVLIGSAGMPSSQVIVTDGAAATLASRVHIGFECLLGLPLDGVTLLSDQVRWFYGTIRVMAATLIVFVITVGALIAARGGFKRPAGKDAKKGAKKDAGEDAEKDAGEDAEKGAGKAAGKGAGEDAKEEAGKA